MLSYHDSFKSIGGTTSSSIITSSNSSNNNNNNDPLEAFLGVFPCARLRGLPFEASLEDVLVFFQGLVVLDVVVVNNGQNGSCEAFVVFANPMDFQMALQRDRQNIGRRYIEVYQGKRSEYYAAIASQHAKTHPSPSSEGESSKPIHDIDNNNNNTPNNAWSNKISTITSPPTASLPPPPSRQQHPPSSTTKTKPSPPPPSSSRRPPHHHHNGSPSSPQHHPLTTRRSNGGGIQIGDHTGYLRMRGLPFTATKRDICHFFSDFRTTMIADSVVLTYRNDGRATGEAYVAFTSPEEAKRAMALHRNTMGSRYIELFISHREEHARSLQRSGGGR